MAMAIILLSMRGIVGKSWLVIFSLLVAMLVGGCQPQSQLRNDLPDPLIIGVLPFQEPDRLRGTLQPLLDYLAESLAVEIELAIVGNYEDLVTEFGAGNINIASFGGVGFVAARDEYAAVPIVSREIDQRYTSYIIVHADNDGTTLLDLQSTNFIFGPADSTSGHVMPRYFLQNAGVVPEEAFAALDYSDSHLDTLNLLTNEEYDAGAVSAEVVDRLFQFNQLNTDKIRVLWESPPYFNYTWAILPNYSESVINRIRNAFLALTESNSRHAEILQIIGAQYYVPTSAEDYEALREILAAEFGE